MMLDKDYSNTTLSSSFCSRGGEGIFGDSFNDIIDRVVADAKGSYSLSYDDVLNYSSTKSCDSSSLLQLEPVTVEDNTPDESVYPYIHGSCDETLFMMEPTPIGSDIDIVESFEHEHGNLNMDSWRQLLQTLNQAEDIMSGHSCHSDSNEPKESANHRSKRRQDPNAPEPMKRQKMMSSPKRLTVRHEAVISLPFCLFNSSYEEPAPTVNEVKSSGVPDPSTVEETLKTTRRQAFRQSDLQNWATQYEAMAEFRSKHGHCFVPNNYSENLKLSRWVKRQRYQYKLKQEGQRHNLTPDRQLKLEALGFIWDAHKVVWEERYLELLRYRNRYGSTQVPFGFHDKKLAIWVKCQRRHYRLYQQGKPSSMTSERLAKLEKINFD